MMLGLQVPLQPHQWLLVLLDQRPFHCEWHCSFSNWRLQTDVPIFGKVLRFANSLPYLQDHSVLMWVFYSENLQIHKLMSQLHCCYQALGHKSSELVHWVPSSWRYSSHWFILWKLLPCQLSEKGHCTGMIYRFRILLVQWPGCRMILVMVTAKGCFDKCDACLSAPFKTLS